MSSSTPKADIGLRPYYPQTDKKYVHYLFYTTYFHLVPRAVLRKLTSPYILGPWMAFYACSLAFMYRWLMTSFTWSNYLYIITFILFSISFHGFGALFLFWYTDKYDIANRVLDGVNNDLKEPDQYYRGTPKEPRIGNFWVLTLNNEIVGCIGMDHNPAIHKPTEASVRRLAVKLDCQQHGLSTVLLKRVAFWAHAHQIEYLYAECDELQTNVPDILVKRHGYKLMEKKKQGLFGEKSTFRLDVKLWMSQELERRKEEKILEDLQKEEEELKEFE